MPWKAADFHAEHPPARSPSVKLLRRLHAADAIDGQLSGFSDTRPAPTCGWPPRALTRAWFDSWISGHKVGDRLPGLDVQPDWLTERPERPRSWHSSLSCVSSWLSPLWNSPRLLTATAITGRYGTVRGIGGRVNFCPSCGVPAAGVRFCGECGANLVADPRAGDASSAPVATTRPVPVPEDAAATVGPSVPSSLAGSLRPRRRLAGAAVALAVIVAAGVLGAAVVVGRRGGVSAPGDRGAAKEAAPATGGFDTVFANAKQATVRVDVQTCDGDGTGTGFFLDSTHVLTAAHVVDGASHINGTVDGHPISLAVLGIDRGQDVALLVADQQHRGPTVALASKPNVGLPVAAIGFPAAAAITLTSGTVSGVDRELTWQDGRKQTGLIQTDTPINPGNSGGPLVDTKGHAVGVVVVKDLNQDSTAFAVAADVAAADVRGWLKHPQRHYLNACDGQASAQAPATSLPTGSSGSGSGPSYVAPTYLAASCIAPSSRDSAGTPVGYDPDNLVDRDAATAWRCPGSGVGVRIVLTYTVPITVSAVGMLPGYAKIDPSDGTDRYPQNRRITRARWTFDDGTSVVQDLDGSSARRDFQSIRVASITTGTITLDILDTSAPGSRNYAAISEIGIYGE